jgi:serine/threonine protein kinase
MDDIGHPQMIQDIRRIVLTREVAQGGMCVVYEAKLLGCEGFAKRVAVKMLRSRWARDERFMRQFIGEAKLVCDLVHENIAQIYQLGRLPGGDYYIVMEFVDGLSLRDFMTHHFSRGRRIPPPLAVHIASRIARGLAFAHAFKDRQGRPLQIVHRDVCPNNILITTEGLSKLIDFGVAKALSQTVMDDRWLTGKVRYMSPEQAARRTVDFRSDIYSLGAVLFEMLSGTTVRPPEANPQTDDFAAMHPPWHRLPRDTDSELMVLMERALAADPARRHQDANQMAWALEYQIYKDGYGPTIQTVEAYLREHFPDLYRRGPPPPAGRVVRRPAASADEQAETVAEEMPGPVAR